MTFGEILDDNGIGLDCDVIVDNQETSATLVWDDSVTLTKEAREEFAELLQSEAVFLPNGNIEVFCNNFELGERFLLCAAGYCRCSEYDRLFRENE